MCSAAAADLGEGEEAGAVAALGSCSITVTEGHVALHCPVFTPADAARRRGEGKAACRARPGTALTSRAGAALAAALAEGLHGAHLQQRLSHGTKHGRVVDTVDSTLLHVAVPRILTA